MEDELLEELWLIRHCKKEYDEEICTECKYRNYEIVSHPGGHYSAKTESYYCEHDYWEDDF